ncbi:dienelactone hydrolase [Schlegelella sp. ID0723]|uniref:Dienelactone hydrolase n=1 Tax=Piscinibacter koreensis TaxID=2742824 RepID=A0A7Y6NLX1_9BURK|nr:dienelactone hydrolase [Schlegelella koreensis]
MVGSASAEAGVGLTTISATHWGAAPVTLFYPSTTPDTEVVRGPFRMQLAADGLPAAGNGRLVVISHGSGGSPWPHSDLARTLVSAGFAVALPEHAGDNHRDTSAVGPQSWTARPAEVSAAVDAVAADARFARLLQLDRVGVFGFSAGGHAALVLAGARWSPARFAAHCRVHMRDDFPACVGLATALRGDAFDAVKTTLASWVLQWRFDDAVPKQHHDARIAVVVAAMPHVNSFDPGSLAALQVPVGIVAARHDRWLVPALHGDVLRRACASRCTLLADLPEGGHGALLSPMPPQLPPAARALLADPPGFDRRDVPAVHARIAAFFVQHLLG